jgi:hypothetical protein
MVASNETVIASNETAIASNDSLLATARTRSEVCRRDLKNGKTGYYIQLRRRGRQRSYVCNIPITNEETYQERLGAYRPREGNAADISVDRAMRESWYHDSGTVLAWEAWSGIGAA